jgi:hypothetical protein
MAIEKLRRDKERHPLITFTEFSLGLKSVKISFIAALY